MLDFSARTRSIIMIFAARPSAYIALILVVVVGTLLYSLRLDGLFACQASGYDADHYAAYCQAPKYGDYDHGAFWFDLEPEAVASARNADVLFLGNSRMQFALSSDAASQWFSSLKVPHFLLGFSHHGNYHFTAPLLQKLGPQAKVYVINVDLFFEPEMTRPANRVLRDPSAPGRYDQKRRWQYIHEPLCQSLPALCGDQIAFFRSRRTGAWLARGGRFESEPVTYDEQIDQNVVEAYTAAGKDFLATLPVRRECVIMTMVPTLGTPSEAAKAIARALDLNLIAPQMEGLITFDGSHLDESSSERWSTAFMEVAGSQIQTCLDES
ncbi:MAG: hypothetical protein AMJ63_03230 [Myxococcales bacterium SG8_38_1]|jgi:hypothetical protein|nr:MAG: hypothetical protein AMJ63_03230 [Myxococcales bacterium SG8_38_1]